MFIKKLIQKSELMSKGRCFSFQLQQYQSTYVKIPATAAMRSRLPESFRSNFQLKSEQGGQCSDHPACLPGTQKLAHACAAQYNHATSNAAGICHPHLLISSAEIPRAAGRLCSSLPGKTGRSGMWRLSTMLLVHKIQKLFRAGKHCIKT